MARLLAPICLIPALLFLAPALHGADQPATASLSPTLRLFASEPTPARIITFGQVFRGGEFRGPVTAIVDGAAIQTQTDIKRRHPDGSVRHAIISIAAASMPAGATREVLVSQGSASGAPRATRAVSPPDLVVEIIEGDVRYRASPAEVTPDPWIDGELVTESRYAVTPRNTSHAGHPTLRVLFDLRFERGAATDVSVTVENTLVTPERGDRTYAVRIIGSRDRTLFTHPRLTHFNHTRWRRTFSLDGARRPDVQINPAYLVQTGVIPRYDVGLSIPDTALDPFLRRKNGPLDTGVITPYMPTTGGRADIGLLPGWSVLALLSRDPRARALLLEAGDLGGSFSIHYRDPKTHRIVSIDDSPGFTLNRAAAESMPGVGSTVPTTKLPTTTPYSPDTAHQPSLAFLPYVLTGDRYFLDELYFWANWNLIDQNFEYRGRSLGWITQNQVRAQAWSLRTLAHAAWIAPDTDPERSYFESKVRNNLARYRSIAIDSNPFGWWGENEQAQYRNAHLSPETKTFTTPFESDFLFLVSHWLVQLGYTDAAPLRDWLGRFVVGRFSNAPAFDPDFGAAYALAVRATSGRVFDNWSTIYINSTVGLSRDAAKANYAGCTDCFAAIARAALAAAVDTQLPRAVEAYRFLDGAIRRANGTDDPFRRDPTWAIVPVSK